MFTVLGYLNGISCGVQVSVDDGRADDGVVAGDPRVISLLQSWEGMPVSPGVGLRTITGTNNDPAWVLACLHAHVQVTDIYGDDVPSLSDSRGGAGAIF